MHTPADSLFIVHRIIIEGNKKTKEKIILREIPIKEGESYSIPILVKKFEDSRRQLMNTSLFHSVVVSAKNFNGTQVDVSIVVNERWYLFPLPYFKPVDRNLNQWIVEQKASLKRVNFGVKLLYGNATGRNDKLKLYLVGGYTKQISLSYDRLYIDKKMKWGARFTTMAGKNREINYNTINDRQAFLKHNDLYLRNFFHSQIELTYRRAIKTRHSIGIGYTYERVHDTVTTLNPTYFNNGKKKVSYPEIFYKMTYYHVDYIPYPTKGFAMQVAVAKKGLNSSFNLWELSVRNLVNWHIFPKTYLGIETYGSVKFPLKQPFFNQQFLGYQDLFLQGYEYYVIDGVAGGYLKATLAKEFFNFKIRVPPIKKGKEAQYIPFRIIGKVFGNSGYVHNPMAGENSLNDKALYSGGLGIDILTFYDVTFKLEWSFNQLGQNGLFLHRKIIF